MVAVRKSNETVQEALPRRERLDVARITGAEHIAVKGHHLERAQTDAFIVNLGQGTVEVFKREEIAPIEKRSIALAKSSVFKRPLDWPVDELNAHHHGQESCAHQAPEGVDILEEQRKRACSCNELHEQDAIVYAAQKPLVQRMEPGAVARVKLRLFDVSQFGPVGHCLVLSVAVEERGCGGADADFCASVPQRPWRDGSSLGAPVGTEGDFSVAPARRPSFAEAA